MVLSLPTPRSALLAQGVPRSRIDQDLRMGRTTALLRGVHVDAALQDDFLTRCAAAVSTQDVRAVLSHRSAAVAHGLRWLPAWWSTAATDVDVAVAPGRTTARRAGIALWERSLAPEDVEVVQGIACMSVPRTLVELARERRVAPLLVVQLLDGALRDDRTSLEELHACLARLRGHANVTRARSLVGRARTGVDSAQETRLRLTLEDGGVGGLQTDIRIEDDGRLLARSELGDPRLLLWGEYDGYREHTERRTFDADRPRERWVEGRGWLVIRYAGGDFANPTGMCRDWLRAAAQAPARIAAMPASRSPEVAAARRLLGLD